MGRMTDDSGEEEEAGSGDGEADHGSDGELGTGRSSDGGVVAWQHEGTVVGKVTATNGRTGGISG